MPDSIALDDQLEAACTDTAQRAVLAAVASIVGGLARLVTNSHLEAAASTRLALALIDDDVTLCEHVAGTPTRLVWSPGMSVLGCVDEFTAYAEACSHACDYCDAPMPNDHGRLMFSIGPVTVFATACETCREQPVDGTTIDPASIREQAAVLVVAHLRGRWSAA